MCPWEARKVKKQTSAKGAFPTSTIAAFNQVKATEGTNGFYKGITPLWGRQVPYTIVKFVAFEKIVQAFYKNIFTKEKS